MPLFPTPDIAAAAQTMEDFEAAPSRKRTGTGSRREGATFESLVATFWSHYASYALTQRGATGIIVRPGKSGRRTWTRVTLRERELYLPTLAPRNLPRADGPQASWLRLRYPVAELIAAFPGEHEAVERYAPAHGPFAGKNYPTMYRGRTTEFDDCIVLVEGGVLRKKWLLEYKTAKSSAKRSIDGNAHERLSFQALQYLEVATRYTSCAFAVLSNGAFARYRNKYHVSFRQQAERLENFSWFRMEHCCIIEEYAAFLQELTAWLLGKTTRR